MKNNWLTLKSLFLCVSALSASGLILSGCTENANLNVGEWSLEYDAHANGIDISKGSKLIYDNVYAAYNWPTVLFRLVIMQSIMFLQKKSMIILEKGIIMR